MKKLFLSLLVALATTASASAIDFDARITNLDGSVPKDEAGKVVEMSIGTICVNALMQPYPDEQNLAGEEKLKRMDLAQRIQRRDAGKYSAEEVALIKKLVNRAYPSPLVVSQTWRVLEEK